MSLRHQPFTFRSLTDAMEEEAMLRKGIVALMIGVMSVGSIQAQDSQKSSGLLDLFRGISVAPIISLSDDRPLRLAV